MPARRKPVAKKPARKRPAPKPVEKRREIRIVAAHPQTVHTETGGVGPSIIITVPHEPTAECFVAGCFLEPIAQSIPKTSGTVPPVAFQPIQTIKTHTYGAPPPPDMPILRSSLPPGKTYPRFCPVCQQKNNPLSSIGGARYECAGCNGRFVLVNR